MITVANASYSPGRNRALSWIVCHTAETPCEPGRARNIAAYLASPSVRASAHYVVDPDNTVAQVDEADTAWAAPGANAQGIQIEQAAYARFGPADWASGPAERMIRTQLAPLVADICKRHGLPAQWLSAADLVAGKRGITDHKTVNDAFGQSDHWDCGTSFPSGALVAFVDQLLRGGTLAGPGTPTLEPQRNDEGDEDMLQVRRSKLGHILLVDGLTYRIVPGVTWDVVNARLIELGAAHLVKTAADGAPLIEDIGDNALQALVEVGR